MTRANVWGKEGSSYLNLFKKEFTGRSKRRTAVLLDFVKGSELRKKKLWDPVIVLISIVFIVLIMISIITGIQCMFLDARKYPATESLLLWWVGEMRIIMRDHKDDDNDKKIIKTVEDCEFFCFCFGHGGHSSSPTYCIHQIPNSRYTIPYQIRHLKSQITPSLIPNTSTTKIHSVLLQRRFFHSKFLKNFLASKCFGVIMMTNTRYESKRIAWTWY